MVYKGTIINKGSYIDNAMYTSSDKETPIPPFIPCANFKGLPPGKRVHVSLTCEDKGIQIIPADIKVELFRRISELLPEQEGNEEVLCHYHDRGSGKEPYDVTYKYFCCNCGCSYKDQQQHRLRDCESIGPCACGKPGPYTASDMCKACATKNVASPIIDAILSKNQKTEQVPMRVVTQMYKAILNALIPERLSRYTSPRALYIQQIMRNAALVNIIPSESQLTKVLRILSMMDMENLRVCTKPSVTIQQILLYDILCDKAKYKSHGISEVVAATLVTDIKNTAHGGDCASLTTLLQPSAEESEMKQILNILGSMKHEGSDFTAEMLILQTVLQCELIDTKLNTPCLGDTIRELGNLSVPEIKELRLAMSLASSAEVKEVFFKTRKTLPELFSVFLHVEKSRQARHVNLQNTEGTGSQTTTDLLMAKHSPEALKALLMGTPAGDIVDFNKSEYSFRRFEVPYSVECSNVHVSIYCLVEMLNDLDLTLQKLPFSSCVEGRDDNSTYVPCFRATRENLKKYGIKLQTSKSVLVEFHKDGSFACYATDNAKLDVEVNTSAWTFISHLMSFNMKGQWPGPFDKIEAFIEAHRHLEGNGGIVPVYVI